MMDRENVIRDLRYVKSFGRVSNNPQLTEIAESALELLKEQQPKTGHWINPTSQDCHCSKCGEQPVHEPGESVPLYDFCPYCGAKMEWSTNT